MILYRIRDAFNWWHQIGDGIKEGFNGKGGQYFEILPIMIGLAGSVWLHTQSQYDGIDDSWRKDPGGRVISTIVCGGIYF